MTDTHISPDPAEHKKPLHFLQQLIRKDLEQGVHKTIATRFPPEPNGYLHIGHAKSICLNFGLAEEFGGTCNLRFDDTNPEKESEEYVNSIMEDVQWLGFKWNGEVRYTSDYFDQLYRWAIYLIEQGLAFVCDLNAEQMREYRGTLVEAGKNSPYRDRSVAENLSLFEKMRAGEFEEGACSLRAKIDMASPNINLRDPILIALKKHITIKPATSGASIRPTIMRMGKVMPSRALPIPFAPWSLKTTNRFTIGLSSNCLCLPFRINMNSHV